MKSPPPPLSGAQGDGITDDYPFIQNICDNYAGQEILIGGNTTVKGEGMNTTIIKLKNGSNSDVIGTPDDTVERYWVRITNIGIDGNAQYQDSGNAISLYNTSEFTLDNLRVSNPKHSAIVVGGDVSTGHDYGGGVNDWIVTYEETANTILTPYNSGGNVLMYLPNDFGHYLIRNATGHQVTVRATGQNSGGSVLQTATNKLVFYDGNNYSILS